MTDYNYKYKANLYDEEVKEYGNYLHDLLFGLCYEFVKPDELILDLGIGTGLASINFSKIGLKIYGLDKSDDMLKICKSKSFTEDLIRVDLLFNKIPYQDDYFNHVLSCGIVHFFKDLEFVFKEVSRVIKKNGVFAFTFALNRNDIKFQEEMTSWNIQIFKHSHNYIRELLSNIKMEIVKEQKILLKCEDNVNNDRLFSVMVARSK